MVGASYQRFQLLLAWVIAAGAFVRLRATVFHQWNGLLLQCLAEQIILGVHKSGLGPAVGHIVVFDGSGQDQFGF